MTSATGALQAAFVAAIGGHAGLAELSGVFDGPPARAAYPYAAIGDWQELDWSTKSERGRELRTAIVIWDDGGEPARMNRLLAAAQAAIDTLPRDLAGWRIASLVFVRSLIARDPDGPWAGLVEHRVRLFETL